MKLKKLLGLALAGVMVFTAACQNNNGAGTATNPPSNPTQTAAPTTGDTATATPAPVAEAPKTDMDADQTLNLFFVAPLTLDVNDARNSSEFQVMCEVFEGLVRVFTDANGNEIQEPAGAESWEVSADGITWTFHIRDHEWSDGVKVTAGQYVDSILRLLNPEKAFSYAFYAFDIKGAEAYYNGEGKIEDIGVKALDEKTLEITLERVSPQFESKLGFACLFPIRLDLVEAGGDLYATDITKHAYNGPFLIKEWVQDHSMTLVKNPTYWDAENVHLTTVNMTTVDEIATKAQLFESQQMDVIEGVAEYTQRWEQKAAGGEFQFVLGKYPQHTFMTFDQHQGDDVAHLGGLSGLMLSQKVRLAVSLSIDREELTQAIYGRHWPSYGMYPYGIAVSGTEFRELYKDEPLKAEYDKYANDDAGLQALFIEGMKEVGVDKPLSEVTLVYNTGATTSVDKASAEYIQQTLQNRLGIKVELNILDSKVVRDRRNADEWDIMLMGWHGDYNDPMTFADMWLPEGGFIKFFGWYNSPAYSAEFEKLAGATDAAKRAEIYANLERIATVDDAGILPLYYNDNKTFVQNYVKDFNILMFGPQYEFSRAYIVGK